MDVAGRRGTNDDHRTSRHPAALKLPRQSRAKIAETLTFSLVDNDVLIAGGKIAEARWRAYRRANYRRRSAAAVDTVWKAEIKRRVEAIQRGNVIWHSGDEVLRELKKKYSNAKESPMATKAATLLKQAVKLPKKTRARLANQILDSIDYEERLLVGARLAQARFNAVDRAEMDAEPAHKVIEALLARKAKKRS